MSLWRGASLLSESARSATRRKVDVVGMALLVVAVGAIALAIVESESPAWTRTRAGGRRGTGVIALVAFVVWAKSVREPLVDLGLFRHRTYSAVNAATLSFGIAFAMMFFAFFFYMSNVWHYSQARAGLAIAPGPLMVIPVAIVTGRLAGRYGHRPFLVGGALLYAAAGLWFLLVPGVEPVVRVALAARPLPQRGERRAGAAVACRAQRSASCRRSTTRSAAPSTRRRARSAR